MLWLAKGVLKSIYKCWNDVVPCQNHTAFTHLQILRRSPELQSLALHASDLRPSPFHLVLCRSRTCRSNEQIFWVNVRERDSRPQQVVRERETPGHESRSRCHSLMICVTEDVVLVHVLCRKWRCVTHSLTQDRGVDSHSVTVLLKLASVANIRVALC